MGTLERSTGYLPTIGRGGVDLGMAELMGRLVWARFLVLRDLLSGKGSGVVAAAGPDPGEATW